MELAPGSRDAVVHARERTKGFGLRGVFSLFLILVVIISVFAVTLVTYLQARQLARNEIRTRLVSAAAAAALAMDADRHARIPIEKAQNSADYWELQVKLRKLQKSIPDVRYVYTLRLNKNNQMIFVGDSDVSQFKSHVGEIYKNETAAMRAAFTKGFGVVAEQDFGTDRWGTWLSGYAPLVRRNGTVEAILGVDIAANHVKELEKRYLAVGLFSALVIVAGLLPFLLIATHAITKPLRTVTAALKRIRELDLNSETSVNSKIREVNELNNALEATRVGLRSFKKYIPGDLATEVVSSRVEAKTGVRKREITILFTDFEGFTSLSESVAPDVLVQLLNRYFEAISRIVEENKGTLDKFIGDAVMAFWNAPADVPNHPEQACRAALQIVDRIRAINMESNKQGQPGLNIRVGVHTGIAMVGNIGHEGRLNYTALGDTVNMASRIEALNKKYGTQILISASTAERLDKSFEARAIEDVVLKGKTKAVQILELRGVRPVSEV